MNTIAETTIEADSRVPVIRLTRDFAATPEQLFRAHTDPKLFPAFLTAGTGIELPPGPAVDDDPVGAWQHHCDAVQAVLDDPATAERVFAHPHIGELPLDGAIDQFYTTDVFMHTWDLARATGQDDRLDPDFCAELFAGMESMEAVIRSSGHYGVRVPVKDDADAQTKLLGFIGRDPEWTPPHR
ncbi:TIGR03086 family protein [Dactylosporangium darangshiense]|uniref:TIGR03086 family protein n=1 Tax=Dactylosporangium darangshiense TaxID=579108 RepID=A0ABP8CX31_9ACTN